jgi:hypothetical protein
VLEISYACFLHIHTESSPVAGYDSTNPYTSHYYICQVESGRCTVGYRVYNFNHIRNALSNRIESSLDICPTLLTKGFLATYKSLSLLLMER